MRYLPHTQEEINEMLAVVGQKSLDDLFATLPAACRYQGDIDLPPAMTEWQLLEHTSTLADAMKVTPRHVMMIGAGSYSHFVPEAVKMLAGRSEFLTAYTPYQPEMAQGTLQGIYEYQTLTARLLGMDVANASLYDGASALAEALLMGIRVKKKKRTVAVSGGCHPHHRQVVKTYFSATEYTVIELPLCSDGRTDLSELARYPDLAAVALQSPNFFGVIEDLEAAASQIHGCDALFITSFTEPFAYGIYKNPGACGADIACGDGQSFGLAKSMGGAGLGMFACRNEFVRSMPGRLVGTTLDLDGRRGFVLTLSTREQHIRREKATSNICSNQGLCAMTAGMFMASLGGSGLRQLAEINFSKTEYMKDKLAKAGAKIVYPTATFNEFLVRFDRDFKKIHDKLFGMGIVAGLAVKPYISGSNEDCWLFCVTETVRREHIDMVVEEVRQ